MIKKILSVYSSNLILGLLGVITVPILLDQIGAEGYGLYALYLTMVSYFTIFELGVLKHLTRLISQGSKKIDVIISTFFYFTMTIVIVVMLIVILSMYFFFESDWRVGAFIGIISAIEYLFFLPTKINLTYAKAHKTFERISLFNFISGLFRYSILIIGALITQNIYLILVLISIRRIFDIRLSKVILKENISIFSIRNISILNLRQVISFYKESIFLSGAQALQININGMVALIISKVFGLHELGIYRSVFDFLSKIWFFSNGLGMVIFPYFASETTGANKNKKYIKISWLFYSAIFVVLIVIFPWINTYILSNILNNDYGSLLYLFMLVGVLLIAQGNLSYEYLQAQGSYKILMIISLISNMVFILLTVFFNMYFSYLYIVLLCWMISIFIQTIIFERKASELNNSLLVLAVAVIFTWLTIGFLILNYFYNI
jgi:O-antigen/teichoic acid export membrane protein